MLRYKIVENGKVHTKEKQDDKEPKYEYAGVAKGGGISGHVKVEDGVSRDLALQKPGKQYTGERKVITIII